MKRASVERVEVECQTGGERKEESATFGFQYVTFPPHF